MSVRSDLFEYLKKKPDSTLADVQSEFKAHKDSTVRRYYSEFNKKLKTKSQATPPDNLKAKKPKPRTKTPKSKAKTSIKEQLYNYLNKNKNASTQDLRQVFPKINRKTISNNRREWLKGQQIISSTSDEKQKIHKFLDSSPLSNLNDLRKAFPDVGNGLITIFRSWKSKQDKNRVVEKTSSKPADKAKQKTGDVKKYKKKIETHEVTIAHQKGIIDKQKTRIAMLKSKVIRPPKTGIGTAIKKFIAEKILKS